MSDWVFKVGFRYLKARKKTGFVSVIAGFSFLGIMLGVATLIIVMSVMNGFRDELMSRILGTNGHLSIQSAWGPVFNADNNELTAIRKTAGVSDVMPLLQGHVMASTNDSTQGILLQGIYADDFAERPLFASGFIGDMKNFNNGVVLGYRLAAKLAARIGDKINLISPNGNVTAFGTMPRTKTYTVVGTFDTGMYDFDANIAFMPMEQAGKFLSLENKYSQIEIFLSDGNMIDFVAEELSRKIQPTSVILDWKHSNQAFFNAIEVERNVMFLILTLIIIVAAFNIISGLIMLVKDKTKDIAILRTMGASQKNIMSVFLIDGCFVGFVGTILGVGLGLLISLNIESIRRWLERLAGRDLFSAEIYFLSQLPSKTDFTEVFWVAVLALSLSFLATLYPSWRASKTDPVEALRYE